MADTIHVMLSESEAHCLTFALFQKTRDTPAGTPAYQDDELRNLWTKLQGQVFPQVNARRERGEPMPA